MKQIKKTKIMKSDISDIDPPSSSPQFVKQNICANLQSTEISHETHTHNSID